MSMEWAELPNGELVNVSEDDLTVVSVVFTDPRERPRDLPMALNGREIDHIEVIGKKREVYRRMRDLDWDDFGMTD